MNDIPISHFSLKSLIEESIYVGLNLAHIEDPEDTQYFVEVDAIPEPDHPMPRWVEWSATITKHNRVGKQWVPDPDSTISTGYQTTPLDACSEEEYGNAP